MAHALYAYQCSSKVAKIWSVFTKEVGSKLLPVSAMVVTDR